MFYEDLIEDCEYIVTAFTNGRDAGDYDREIKRLFADLKKARNKLWPMPTGNIEKLISKSMYNGGFDFRIFVRLVEKEHLIGEGEGEEYE